MCHTLQVSKHFHYFGADVNLPSYHLAAYGLCYRSLIFKITTGNIYFIQEALLGDIFLVPYSF
jgi:hypothetical protein